MKEHSARIVVNSLLLFSQGVIGRLSNFFFTLLVVRYLTISNFGLYSSILSFIAVGMALAEFGISYVLIREVAQRKERSREFFSAAILISVPLFFFTTSGMIGAAIVAGYSKSFIMLLTFATLGVLGNSLVLISESILRALERMTFFSILNTFLLVFSALTGAVWLRHGAGIRELVILFVSVPIINAVILSIYIVPRFVSFSMTSASKTVGLLLREAAPLAVFNLCAIVLMRYDILLLSRARGMAETGIFCAARNITDTLALLITSVIGAVFPFIAVRWKDSTQGASRNYEQTLRFFTLFGVAATSGIFFLSEKIVLLLYRDRYVESALCLKILIWAFLLNALSGPVGMFLIVTRDRLKQYIPYALAVTLVSVALNMWLTPVYGYTCASLIAVLTALLLFVFKMVALRDILPIRPRWLKISWRPIVAGVVMGVVLHLIGSHGLGVLVPTGFLVYIVVLALLGEFAHDYRVASSYLRKPET